VESAEQAWQLIKDAVSLEVNNGGG